MIEVQKLNECHVKVMSDIGTETDVRDYFTFKVPGYQFSKQYKARMWDGNISLYNIRTKLLPIGLYPRLQTFAKDNEIELRIRENERYSTIFDRDTIDRSEVEEFVYSLNLWSKNGPLTVRDYQLDAIYETVCQRKITLLSPTSSGKSLIIYCLIRWILEQEPETRVLLLVPSVGLVNQMMGDFREYASQSDWDVDKQCQKLYSGQNKELSKRVLITTWQSFSKVANDKVNGAKILSLYRGVIADEAHGAKGKEMQSILEKCIYADFKIGTTGTIDNSKMHQLVIEGFLGPLYKVTTTRELMDTNQVSQLKIKALVLKYLPEEANLLKKAEYPDEVKWLIQHEARNRFLVNLANSMEGATLLLVRNRDTHAKVLYEKLKATSKKPVYYIAGDVDAELRETIRHLANVEDCIIVATFATMSTGVNIPNLRNVIFGSPSKSSITVLQSIGRGLRLHNDKSHMTLVDVIDDIRYKKRENYAYQHGIERLTIYRKERFDIAIKELPLAKF